MAYYLQINDDEKVLIGHFTETLNDVVPSDVTGADIYYRLDVEALASDNPSVESLFGVFQSYIKQVTITSIKIYQDDNVIYQTDKYNHIYEEYASKSNGIVSVVDPLDSMKEEDFVEDGYHVNGKGNTKIFEELYQELKELL